mmetsp:Transcript_21909/g.38867  ORF Transcript_21909/g.38867 Transcript_21909/m.38867 type:complete len:422 (+) Transcript_21909:41-1306(+)
MASQRDRDPSVLTRPFSSAPEPMALLHVKSPLPSGYGCREKSPKIEHKNETKFPGPSKIRNVTVRAGIGDLETELLLSPTKNDDELTILSPIERDFGAEYSFEQDSLGCQDDLLGPITCKNQTSSLFPVLPSFDCPISSGESWIKEMSNYESCKEAFKSGGGSLNQRAKAVGSEEEPLDLLSSVPKLGWEAAGPPRNLDLSGSSSPVVPKLSSGLEPPALRRYVSVPKIQLNFDDKGELSTDDVDMDYRAAMNFEIDAALGINPSPATAERSNALGKSGGVRPEPKSFACSSCKLSKTKCEGFPCMRCERLGRQCKRDDKGVKRKHGAIGAASQESCRMFAEQIVDFYRKKTLKSELQIDVNATKKEKKKRRLLVKHHAHQSSSSSSPAPTQCYRNEWCVRPYRHPGHCKDKNYKRKSRSK